MYEVGFRESVVLKSLKGCEGFCVYFQVARGFCGQFQVWMVSLGGYWVVLFLDVGFGWCFFLVYLCRSRVVYFLGCVQWVLFNIYFSSLNLVGDVIIYIFFCGFFLDDKVFYLVVFIFMVLYSVVGLFVVLVLGLGFDEFRFLVGGYCFLVRLFGRRCCFRCRYFVFVLYVGYVFVCVFLSVCLWIRVYYF